MAMSKQFMDQVGALNNRGAQVAKLAGIVGEYSVKAAYSNGDTEPAQYLMDNLPQYLRAPMARWLKRAGIETIPPAVDQKNYIVQGVLDQKRQAKAFEFVKTTPVLEVEAVEKKEKKPRELKGTADERAAKAAADFLTRLKERDAEAAYLLNDRFAALNMSCLFDAHGNKITLDDNELELIFNLLDQREALKLRAA